MYLAQLNGPKRPSLVSAPREEEKQFLGMLRYELTEAERFRRTGAG